MNNSYHIEWGLFLPFRFYANNRNKISEYSDFGRLISVPRAEFLIMPQHRILPFQVVREASASSSYTLHFYCLDTDEETNLSSWLDGAISTDNDDDYDWITFLGAEDSGIEVSAGGYYAKFSDGEMDWYSENFYVMSDAWTETYRKWSENDNFLRTTGEDLRII